jgi:anti-sigma B factor antagonist
MCDARLPAAYEPVMIPLPDEIDIAKTADASRGLAAALRAGQVVVIADLTDTRFISATGAGMLAAAHRDAIAIGCQLRVAASVAVRRILALTQLDQVLAVYPSVSAARAGAPGGVSAAPANKADDAC